MTKEDKILEQVRNLLARAEHPTTPGPESELCYARANTLMVRHAIDEANLRATQTQRERSKPTSKVIKYGEDMISEFWPLLRTMLEDIARTNRCRAVETSSWGAEYTVVGFAEDVSWVEMLYTSCYFTFLSKLRPKWDKGLGYDENVYTFKVAGYKWAEINDLAVDNGEEDLRIFADVENWDWTTRTYTTVAKPTGRIKGGILTAYKRHARKIGDDTPVVTGSFEAYRISYADGFVRRISARLEQMRQDAEKESVGSELVLHGVEEDVNDFFYNMFEWMRPMSAADRDAFRLAEAERRERERAEREAMLARLSPAAKKRLYETEERESRAQARADKAYWRKHAGRTVTRDFGATTRGQNVANSVRLTKSTDVPSAGTRKEIG